MTPLARLLARSFWPVLCVSAIAAVATAIVVSRLPPAVDVSLTFTIPVPGRPASGEYEYDGFYALQATDLFAQTLTGWLASPDVVSRVYERARLPLPTQNVRRLGRLFTTQKLSGQLVEVRFRVRSDAEGKGIAEALSSVIRERVEGFNSAGARGLSFRIVASDPLLLPVLRSVPLRALVGFTVTLVVALNLVIFFDAFRQEPRYASTNHR